MAGGESSWRYPHVNLGERPLPDGSAVLRPCVTVASTRSRIAHIGVVDSGSPISVADPAFLAHLGIDLSQTPIMKIPLGMGASFDTVPLFEVEMALLPPERDGPPATWTAVVGARPRWKHPFAVLLGQRGWFHTFSTTIDRTHTTVHLVANTN